MPRKTGATPIDWAVMAKVAPTLSAAMIRAREGSHTESELAFLNEIKLVWDVTKMYRKRFDWNILIMFVMAALAYEEEAECS